MAISGYVSIVTETGRLGEQKLTGSAITAKQLASHTTKKKDPAHSKFRVVLPHGLELITT